jgi:HNH endonuclease
VEKICVSNPKSVPVCFVSRYSNAILAGREFFFGQYFESVPARQSRAETVLANAIVDFFRSVLAFASPVESLDPTSIEDARKRTLASIVQRQGQGQFRRRLLEAYGRRCAITGCATEKVLDAVHITPYLGKATNSLSNGLLLRSDLHTLFDLGLIGVAPSTFALVLSPSLRNGDYARYAGKQISVPMQPSDQPAEGALKQHLARWKLAI